MASLLRNVARYNEADTHGFFEDWESNYVAADRWTPLTSDSSSAATLVLVDATAPGGILSITQDATDNDEIYFVTTKETILFAANKPCLFETRIQYAEGATDDNNVMVGILSTGAANTLIDDGGGPVASATMAVVYKIDGGTVWRCRSQIGAAVGQTDTITNSTAGGTNYQTIRIEVNPISSTNADVIYSIDEGSGKGMQQMKDSNGKVFKHNLVYTNAVACSPFIGCKNGSATAEVLLCDYITYWQKR